MQGLEISRNFYFEYGEKMIKEQTIIHGSYTYHNIIMCRDGVATTVFDKCAYGLQLIDL